MINYKWNLSVFILTLLSVLIISCGSPPAEETEGKDNAEEKGERGSHGGRLLTQDNFQVEVTIFETGVPPEFRVYAYEDGKPIDPAKVKLAMELKRLGGEVDRFQFQKQADYLRGNGVVEEPHSFDVSILAEKGGKAYNWEYSQVEGRVKMDSEQLQNSGVEIAVAGSERIKTIIELPGEISLNKDKVAHVVPGLSGIVAEVRKNLGDSVKKGEVVAVIQSRELASLKSEYLSASKRLELTGATFQREENLWKKKISSEQDYLNSRLAFKESEIELKATGQKLLALGLTSPDLASILQESESELSRLKIRAPFDGMVIEKNVSLGESIKEDADIFMIADLSTVWVDVTVYAKDLNLVRVGQKVTVQAKTLGLEEQGTLAYVGPLIGEETRSAKALVILLNRNGEWRPGLFVTVNLLQEEVTVPVAVKAEAIQSYRDWSVVFAKFGDQFEVRPLTLGRRDAEWVEVLEGLSPGQEYVSKNSYLLKAELGKAGASHEH